MAILRCNKCSHIREVGIDYLGKSVKCPECKEVTNVHDTVTYFRALFEKFTAQEKVLKNLLPDTSNNKAPDELAEDILFDELDIHNTNALTQAANLVPISEWFAQRNIEVSLNPDAADTTGFFDEIALKMGNDFDELSYVTQQIKYIQNKGYTNVKLDVSKKSAKEVKKINEFCRELYDYSFVARYVYQKKDKVVRLSLQRAPKIRDFFNGLWMEWFALMKLLHYFRDKKMAAACTRSLQVSFAAGNSNEIDIFALSDKNIPLCIECKTGEFRQDIDKYHSLRKQLSIQKDQFVVCVFGLSDEQAVGMTTMYDLTFVNESSLIAHVESVI